MSKNSKSEDKSAPVGAPDKQSLFAAYAAAQAKVEAEEDRVKKAKAGVSAAIRAIKEQVGPGPFRYKGEVVSIRSRGEVYFFATETPKDVDSID